MSTYFALLTITGTAKLANAAALGTQLSITEMAVGDGGGILPTPNTAQTALINERRRAALNMLSIDPANDSQIIAEQVIPESDGGFWIREIGLYDDEGDLIAIANCPETYKPRLQEGSGRVQTVRMILIVSSTDAVTLKIDPSVVLATRRYVDESVIVIQQKIENDGAKIIGLAQGGTVQDAILFLTPEMFGAIGDGVADDTIAIQTAIEYLKTSGAKRAIIGHGDYAISASLTITNFAYGFKMHLRSLRAHNTWPNYDNWKNAKPLISVGGNGGMVGLDIRCDYVNGGDKADWVNVVAQGCGGSHFHAERLTNVVNGYVPKNITWPSASNRITGGYWSDGTGIGIWLQKGSDGIKPIVEGHIIDVNFITGFKRGGTLLRDGAQYSDVRGLFDFNGRFLSEVAVTVNPEGVLVRGDTVTNGSNTAEVIAFYQQPVGSYKLLIAEGHDVSNDGSYFSSDDEITNSDSSWASAVNSVKTPDSAEWYPDIIHDFTGSAFGKCTIYASYCGGIVGGFSIAAFTILLIVTTPKQTE
ncbi:phage tail protein [Brenneria rubrifaciens]|uniref:phage tail protein n=1 Tax=Brenneria rubrifaciens TaxID=55213 RepID=UPI003612D4C4